LAPLRGTLRRRSLRSTTQTSPRARTTYGASAAGRYGWRSAGNRHRNPPMAGRRSCWWPQTSGRRPSPSSAPGWVGSRSPGAWPSEEQHHRALEPVLDGLRGRVATVRVLDFGGDKTPPFLAGATQRGIELLLRAPEALGAQLGAIVRAGRATQLRVMLPMVG